jgi:hypothetical protein
MPTGFYVETGSDLSLKLQGLVGWLEEYLKSKNGRPVTGEEICHARADIRLSGPDIRAMVNYLRRQSKPIGSEANGYFWATEPGQLDATILHLRERLSAIQAALHGLENSKYELQRQKNGELF